MVYAYRLATGVAVLCEHAVEAAEAVWPALPHDVSLAAEVPVTLEAGEVLHVPGAALGLRALVREDDLEERLSDWLRMGYSLQFSVQCGVCIVCSMYSVRHVECSVQYEVFSMNFAVRHVYYVECSAQSVVESI